GIEYRRHLIDALERGVIGLAVLLRTEQRDAEQIVAPHVGSPNGHPYPGAELRPQRLDVAPLSQAAANLAAAPACLIGRQFIMRAHLAQRQRQSVCRLNTRE